MTSAVCLARLQAPLSGSDDRTPLLRSRPSGPRLNAPGQALPERLPGRVRRRWALRKRWLGVGGERRACPGTCARAGIARSTGQPGRRARGTGLQRSPAPRRGPAPGVSGPGRVEQCGWGRKGGESGQAARVSLRDTARPEVARHLSRRRPSITGPRGGRRRGTGTARTPAPPLSPPDERLRAAAPSCGLPHPFCEHLPAQGTDVGTCGEQAAYVRPIHRRSDAATMSGLCAHSH